MGRCFKYFLCLIVAVIFMIPSPVFAAGPLRTAGNIVVNSDGTRFFIKGVNVEAYRDYDGCPAITDNLWINDNLNKMVNAMKQVDSNGGINAVRLDYDSRYINQGSYQNLSKYLDIAQAFAGAGIYVMPSDHSLDSLNYTNPNTDFALATSTWKAIIDGFRARGIDQYLFLDPINETPNFSTKTDMINANEYVLNFLRNTANYKGLVMLTIYWNNSQIDTVSYQSLVTYDAGLLGGTANVAFDNHWYPPYWPVNTYVANSFVTAKTYPLIIGEMGWDYGYPGQDTPYPQYVTDLLNLLLSTGIPNGHNGVFPWMWKWCDNNTMTTPSNDYVTLSTYGNLYKPFWAKVNSGGIIPTVTPTASPLPTPTPTSTPVVKPGDGNGDGKVDGIDYVIWLNHYGQTISGVSNGDYNSDGKVDGIDYVIWLTNYGK